MQNKQFHVLVTGANGFIGKNLIKTIQNLENIVIHTYTRESTLESLNSLLQQVDFIFHLAGEVRPKSNDNEFKKSNTQLTQTIISILEKQKHIIPIVMASSIHAELQKNQYGITKREAELVIENYHNKYNITAINYRLPHVFGEGCKPNYNSVISTWINNNINDIDINVYDRDIKMEYVYVQDIVRVFLSYLTDKTNLSQVYIYPKNTYHTTLGQVVDYLNEFKHSDNIICTEKSFKCKLYEVYQDYLKKN